MKDLRDRERYTQMMTDSTYCDLGSPSREIVHIDHSLAGSRRRESESESEMIP